MFARLVAVTLFALPLFAAATAVEKRQAGSCNVGELQCCNNLQEVDSVSGANMANLLGIVAQPGTLLGFDCNPINVIGGIANAGQCETTPVCCSQNSVGGGINAGCVPINVL